MAEVIVFPALGSSAAVRVGDLIAELADHLSAAQIREAAREAGDLVAAILDAPRFWPFLNRDGILEEDACQRAREAVRRRARGAPFAYAVGRAAFRHLTLEVDERVLIPRQETEVLVECVLARAQHGLVIDVGTGSGAIALALATEGHFQGIIATDVSRESLAVARANVLRLGAALRAPVELRHGSLLAPVRGERAAVIVSNPPYIALEEAVTLPRSVRDWEPPLALFAASQGMALIESIVAEAPDVLEPGGLLALEVDAKRAALCAELAMSDGRYRDVCIERDMAGRDRILLARRN